MSLMLKITAIKGRVILKKMGERQALSELGRSPVRSPVWIDIHDLFGAARRESNPSWEGESKRVTWFK